MAYYRRATVYFAMGKSKSALPDLSKVIELKPDFTAVSMFFSCVEIQSFTLSLSLKKEHFWKSSVLF